MNETNYYFNTHKPESKLDLLLDYEKNLKRMIDEERNFLSNRQQPQPEPQPQMPQWIPHETCFVFWDKKVFDSFLRHQFDTNYADFDSDYNAYCEIWQEEQEKAKEQKKQLYREKLQNKNKQAELEL